MASPPPPLRSWQVCSSLVEGNTSQGGCSSPPGMVLSPPHLWLPAYCGCQYSFAAGCHVVMCAGALRDNGHRAVLIGDTNTYGKGKVPSVRLPCGLSCLGSGLGSSFEGPQLGEHCFAPAHGVEKRLVRKANAEAPVHALRRSRMCSSSETAARCLSPLPGTGRPRWWTSTRHAVLTPSVRTAVAQTAHLDSEMLQWPQAHWQLASACATRTV